MYNVHNESFVMGTKNPDVYGATNYKHMIYIYTYIYSVHPVSTIIVDT